MSGVPKQKSGGHNRRSPTGHRALNTWRADRQLLPTPPRPRALEAPTPSAPTDLSRESQQVWTAFHTEYAIEGTPQIPGWSRNAAMQLSSSALDSGSSSSPPAVKEPPSHRRTGHRG